MTNRFDLYTLVHKGQRRKLGELINKAGAIGAEQAAERQALVEDLLALLGALAVHAEAEDRFIGPLLAECSAELNEHMHAAHHRVEGLMAEARAQAGRAVAEPSPREDALLYRAICRLATFYFEHIDAEEHIGQPALWKRWDDGRLAAAQADIIAAHEPHVVAYNLRCMLPAATPEERVGFLSGMKKRMPPPVFAGMRANVAALVAEHEWRAIDAA